jgi:predicted metalloprotease
MATKQRSKRHARPGLGAIGAGVAGLAALAAVVLAVLFSLGVVGGDSSASPAEKKLKAGEPVTIEDFADEMQAGWKRSFAKEKKAWTPATLATSHTTDDPCQAPAAVYCDVNHTVYLEPEFMARVRKRAGRETQLAKVFVLAHLLGHHVQDQLGITEKVQQRLADKPAQASQFREARDLEADCLAGFGLRGLVNDGVISTQGIERAMTAAAEAGQALVTEDPTDFLQETWHATPLKSRVELFERGLRSANVGACDTLGALNQGR